MTVAKNPSSPRRWNEKEQLGVVIFSPRSLRKNTINPSTREVEVGTTLSSGYPVQVSSRTASSPQSKNRSTATERLL